MNSSGVYKSLEQAAINTIEKLSQIISGKQRNMNVEVRYMLPIAIQLNH